MSPIELNFKVHGAGKPMIIMHGLFGSLDNWQSLVKKIAEHGYQVFTLDARNHGKSPHVADIDHSLMALDISQFIASQQIEAPIVVGHSMGGKTAMQLALTQPNLIDQLVVVDIAPRPYSAHHTTYFKAMNELPVATLHSRKQADEMLSTLVPNLAIRQFLLKNLVRSTPGFRWKFNLEALEANYNKLIGGISTDRTFEGPTLFIAGQQSDYISIADHSSIQAVFPQARIETIEHAGHWVHAERPEEFLNTLLSFIQ